MGLSAKFYQRPVHMEFKSDKEGRPIHEMRDFVRIEIPGFVGNVVDTFVNQDHKNAYPEAWAQFLNEKATGEFSEHQGTLLSDWPQLNAAQVLEMKHYKFHTVEHVAEASDQQLEAIGMLAGMAPASLRDKAIAWLAHAKGKEADSALAVQLAQRDEQIAKLTAVVERLAARSDAPEAPKNKGGRPKKVKEAVSA